jgi:hypothetical protein
MIPRLASSQLFLVSGLFPFCQKLAALLYHSAFDMITPANRQNPARRLKGVLRHPVWALKRLCSTVHLEQLPAELLAQILASPAAVKDLEAAILSSPVLYQAYLEKSKFILGSVLSNTLGERVMVDAYAVQRSLKLDRRSACSPVDVIHEFMTIYKQLLANPAGVWKVCIDEDLVEMAAFHVRIIQPVGDGLLQDFGVGRHNTVAAPVELARVTRALYRLQLWCNLYGTVPGAVCPPDYADLKIEDVLLHFFGVFQPWEIEEVVTLHEALMNEYENRFYRAIFVRPMPILRCLPRRPDDPGYLVFPATHPDYLGTCLLRG